MLVEFLGEVTKTVPDCTANIFTILTIYQNIWLLADPIHKKAHDLYNFFFLSGLNFFLIKRTPTGQFIMTCYHSVKSKKYQFISHGDEMLLKFKTNGNKEILPLPI